MAIKFLSSGNVTGGLTLSGALSGTSATFSGTVTASGTVTLQKSIQLPTTTTGSGTPSDVGVLSFGGNYTTGNRLFVDSSGGTFRIQGSANLILEAPNHNIKNSNGFLILAGDAGVRLFYSNSEKLTTTNTGVKVDGNIKIGIDTMSTPSSNADDIVIDKDSSEAGITIMSETAGSVRWGDASNSSVGSIEYNHNSDYMRFNTNNAERMRIDSSGNVGIGTTAIPTNGYTASGGGWKMLQIGQSSQIAAYGTDDEIAVCQNTYLNTSGVMQGIIASVPGAAMIMFDGKTYFKTYATAADKSQTTITSMFIDTTGNVGIGTTSPQERLHVVGLDGSVPLSSYYGSLVVDNNGEAAMSIIGNSYSSIYFGDAATNFAGGVIYEHSSNSMNFRTNGNSEKMRITSGGNVGIGTTSPAVNLHVQSTGVPTIAQSTSSSITSGSRGDLAWYNSAVSTVANIRATAVTDNVGTGLEFYTRPVGGALTKSMHIASNGSIYNGLVSNTHFGLNALSSVTTADESTAFGNNALGSQQSGRNTAVGFRTLQDLTTGQYNTAVGGEAAENTIDGSFNVSVGTFSLRQNTSGSENTAIGYQSLSNNTTQSKLTALGYRAGYFWTAGDENTFIGHQSGFGTAAASTGYENTFVGSLTGGSSNGITGVRNTALGRYNLFNLTSGDDNVAIGHQSMITLTTGNFNVAVGKDTMASYTGSKNTAIGYAAGKSINSDGDNVFVGYNAGKLRTAGIDNTAVGSFSQYGGTSGSTPSGCCNSSFGFATLHNISTGVQNTAIGRQAGYSITTTDNNTLVGHNVGIFGTGSLNTIVGAQAGSKAGFTGNNNTFLGYTAGDEVTTGGQNLVLGYAAGSGSSPFQLTTQAYRIILGDNSSTDAYIKIDWTVTSDKRDKTDFKEIEHGLDFVDKLKPTEYKFRKNRDTEETDGKRRYGFIAQEILELEGEDSVIIDTEQKDNLKYKQSHLVPVLVKAIQELKAEIELLKNK